MLTLFTIWIVVAAAVAVVTIEALASAPEGFEDEAGFHELSLEEQATPAALAETKSSVSSDDNLPPFAAAR